MTRPKQLALIFLILVNLGPTVSADVWVNEFPVHRVPSFTTDGSEGCLRCHSGEKMRAIAQSAHGNEENPLAPAALHGCETCHGEGSIHVSRAHGGRGFPPLTEFGRGADAAPRESQLQVCLRCHTGADTGNKPIVFHGSVHDRAPIMCSTCHQVHAEIDPMGDRVQQSATCFRCHRKIKESHPQFRGRDVNLDRVKCSACHDVHAPSETQTGAAEQ